MPLILYTFLIFLILLLEKNLRKYFIIFLATSTIIFLLLFNFNIKIKENFINFYHQVAKISTVFAEQKVNKTEMPPYYKEFSTFYETWKINKYIGGGLKGFRYYCHKRK